MTSEEVQPILRSIKSSCATSRAEPIVSSSPFGTFGKHDCAEQKTRTSDKNKLGTTEKIESITIIATNI